MIFRAHIFNFTLSKNIWFLSFWFVGIEGLRPRICNSTWMRGETIQTLQGPMSASAPWFPILMMRNRFQKWLSFWMLTLPMRIVNVFLFLRVSRHGIWSLEIWVCGSDVIVDGSRFTASQQQNLGLEGKVKVSDQLVGYLRYICIPAQGLKFLRHNVKCSIWHKAEIGFDLWTYSSRAVLEKGCKVICKSSGVWGPNLLRPIASTMG